MYGERPGGLKFLIENQIYKEDYENVTVRFLEEHVPYEQAIEAVRIIAESQVFDGQ